MSRTLLWQPALRTLEAEAGDHGLSAYISLVREFVFIGVMVEASQLCVVETNRYELAVKRSRELHERTGNHARNLCNGHTGGEVLLHVVQEPTLE